VAWATFVAQGVACIVALLLLLLNLRQIEVSEKPDWFSMDMLVRIAAIAVPSILQQSFVSIGNLFIQILINKSGENVIAGYSAAVKLNTFAITSFATLSNGISSYTAQNVGAEKYGRIKQGMRAGLVMVWSIAAVFFLIYFIFSKPLISFFMSEETMNASAVQTGVTFLRVVTPFYFAVSIKLLADGVLRGTSSMKYFMITTFTDLILRVGLAYVFFPIWAVMGIWYSWPFGWLVGMILSVAFYFIVMKRLTEKKTS